LPNFDQFIEKVYSKKDAAELILLSTAQFNGKLYNGVAGESGITKLAPQSLNGVALSNCAYSHIFINITAGNWDVANTRAMPTTFDMSSHRPEEASVAYEASYVCPSVFWNITTYSLEYRASIVLLVLSLSLGSLSLGTA
jgi:hypothetical protein